MTEITADPLGAGKAAQTAQTANTVSMEVFSARICEMSASMRNMELAMAGMVKSNADSVQTQQLMLAQMAAARETNDQLLKQITDLASSYADASQKQDAVLEQLGLMRGDISALTKRISTMLDATDKNMSQMSMNTAVLIATTTTPREDGESLKDWRARIGVEAMGMFEWAEEARRRDMAKIENPDA